MRHSYRRMALLLIAGALPALPQTRAAFQADLQREFDVYRDRLFQLAEAIPADKYGWRPGGDVRTIGQVVLHVGLNNYMLLEMMRRKAPDSIYPGLPEGPQRVRAVADKNREYEANIQDKARILELSKAAFAAAAEPIVHAPAASLDEPAMFFERKTTMGGLQLRMVAHLHEHLGQLIAYARAIGVKPPWTR
ncbi:MAG: DinB family protein [Bryobacteraceae bacterium]|nr:DinB family protein [Bryobacteraceae bacterium]